MEPEVATTTLRTAGFIAAKEVAPPLFKSVLGDACSPRNARDA